MSRRRLHRLTDPHLGITLLELDEPGWVELNEALDALDDQALRLQARAFADGSETMRSVLVLAHFERAPESADA